MIFKDRARLATACLALGGALALAAGAAVRAEPYDDRASVGAVTIHGQHRYVRDPETRAVVRTDEVSLVVPLGDLDLSTRVGARVAKARIVRAARHVCATVEQAYPQDVDYGAGCYNRAVRDGMAQAEDAAGYPIVAWGYR